MSTYYMQFIVILTKFDIIILYRYYIDYYSFVYILFVSQYGNNIYLSRYSNICISYHQTSTTRQWRI